MSLLKSFEIAATGLTAQSQRLNAVASNLANAESAAGPDGKAYRAKQVVFQSQPANSPAEIAGARTWSTDSGALQGVKVAGVIDSTTEPRRVHDPKHPLADAEGFVTLPNVNVAEEMVNMLSASRSYQSNVEVMNTAKNLMLKTLSLGS